MTRADRATNRQKVKLVQSALLKKIRYRPPRITVIEINKMEYVKKVDQLELEGNVAEHWRIFKQNFDIFAAAIELSKKPEPVQIAIFLNAIGPQAVEVFNTFNLEDEKEKKIQ